MLRRDKQGKMLICSEIEVQNDAWRAPKQSKRKGVKSVKERIAHLKEMREEELNRKVKTCVVAV